MVTGRASGSSYPEAILLAIHKHNNIKTTNKNVETMKYKVFSTRMGDTLFSDGSWTGERSDIFNALEEDMKSTSFTDRLNATHVYLHYFLMLDSRKGE